MKNKCVLAALMTAALAATPLAPAHAEGYHSHGRSDSGLFLGLFAAGLTGAALAIATSPHTVVVEATQPVYVAPAPTYTYDYYYPPVYRPRPVYRYVTYGYPYPYHTYAGYR